MIAAANVLTELFLSCAALLGLGMLNTRLARHGSWDPLNRRFLFCIRIAMLLFAGRTLVILSGSDWFRIVVLLAAALIPLAVLLLTEGLLRRHAPLTIKAAIAIGTCCFVLLVFFPSGVVDPIRLWGLLTFQVVGFMLSGFLIVSRDKTSLSASENRMVGRLGMSLFLFIPMVAADFLLVYWQLPIQISALSVLIMCWLVIGLGRAQIGHTSAVLSLGALVVGALFASLLIGMLAGFGREGNIIAFVVIAAAMLLAAIFNDTRSLWSEEQSLSLLRHLATVETEDPLAFLRDLQSHPIVEGAAIIKADNLSDLDDRVLDNIFLHAPVLRRSDPPELGAEAADHIVHLFDRYAATHILLAASNPRVLIALSMPSLSTSPYAELELQALQRMTALIDKAHSR